MGNEYGYVLGLDAQTGSELWKFPKLRKPRTEWWRTGAINSHGIMVIGSEKSSLYYAIDTDTGELKWKTTSIGNETGCFPAIADDGTIYLTGGYDGGLYAFDGGGGPLLSSPWPKGMNNNKNTSRN